MSAAPSRLKPGFQRQCRLWHGYLSAFAFGALLFFAITGIALNHPDWFAASEPRSPPVKLTLTSSQRQALRSSPAPAQLLTQILAARTTLYGVYQDGEAEPDRLFVRLRGARGSSDIRANLQDGSVLILSERATTIGWLNALHRGEQTGAVWRTCIDIAAGILIVLSLIGYAIFFSMGTRLTTALLITALSVLGVVLFCVAVVR